MAPFCVKCGRAMPAQSSDRRLDGSCGWVVKRQASGYAWSCPTCITTQRASRRHEPRCADCARLSAQEDDAERRMDGALGWVVKRSGSSDHLTFTLLCPECMLARRAAQKRRTPHCDLCALPVPEESIDRHLDGAFGWIAKRRSPAPLDIVWRCPECVVRARASERSGIHPAVHA